MKISKDAVREVLAAGTSQHVMERARENALSGCSLCATHDCNRCKSGALEAAKSEMAKIRDGFPRNIEGAQGTFAVERRASLPILTDMSASPNSTVTKRALSIEKSVDHVHEIAVTQVSTASKSAQSPVIQNSAPIITAKSSHISSGSILKGRENSSATCSDGNKGISALIPAWPQKLKLDDVEAKYSQHDISRANKDGGALKVDVKKLESEINLRGTNNLAQRASKERYTSGITSSQGEYKHANSSVPQREASDVAGSLRSVQPKSLNEKVGNYELAEIKKDAYTKKPGIEIAPMIKSAGNGALKKSSTERRAIIQVPTAKERFLVALDALSRKVGHMKISGDGRASQGNKNQPQTKNGTSQALQNDTRESNSPSLGTIKARNKDVFQGTQHEISKHRHRSKDRAMENLVQKELRLAIRAEIRNVVRREVKNFLDPIRRLTSAGRSDRSNIARRHKSVPFSRKLHRQLDKLGSSERRLVEQLLDQMLKASQTQRTAKKRSEWSSSDKLLSTMDRKMEVSHDENNSGTLVVEAAEEEFSSSFIGDVSTTDSPEIEGEHEQFQVQKAMISSAQSGPKSYLEACQSMQSDSSDKI